MKGVNPSLLSRAALVRKNCFLKTPTKLLRFLLRLKFCIRFINSINKTWEA